MVIGDGSAVVRLDPTSGAVRTVVSTSSTGPTLVADAWSAATSRIFYTRSGPGERAALAVDSVAQAGGRSRRELTGGFSSDVSRDGRRIVYLRDERRVTNLFVADRGGRNERRLTGAGGYSPRFSADGRRIVFSRFAPTPDGQEQIALFTIRPDGSGLTRVTRQADVLDDDATFSPDGRRLLFTRTETRFGVRGLYSVGLDGRGLRLVRANADAADWASNGWLTYAVFPTRDAPTQQVAVRAPGLRGRESILTRETSSLTDLHFAR